MKSKILIIDDEAAIREVLGATLQDDGYIVETVESGELGLQILSAFQPDLVLLDIWMPGGMDGLETLKKLRQVAPTTEVVMMSGHGTIETAVQATKLGAWDFLEKPLSMDRVSILVKNIESYRTERGEKHALLNKLRKNIAMIGDSPPMVTLKQMISRVAPTQSWVLITGENGTGKELVAQNIHYLSPRAGRPFIEVNCAAIPDELIESELFGHERGAFTGADKSKRGKFDLANGGTLFLDEIGDMSAKTQAKILRILQEQRFERVGGQETIQVDVRVIAATNKDLEAEMRAARFREDLYYRLNVIPFKVPSLRERAADIPALIRHFSQQIARDGGYRVKDFSDSAMRTLELHAWPGNVRELRNFVERVYILTPGEYIDSHDLVYAGLSDRSLPPTTAEEALTFREARARFERDFLSQKIEENQGNISKTAEAIGLERSHLHRKIKSYGIDAQ